MDQYTITDVTQNGDTVEVIVDYVIDTIASTVNVHIFQPTSTDDIAEAIQNRAATVKAAQDAAAAVVPLIDQIVQDTPIPIVLP